MLKPTFNNVLLEVRDKKRNIVLKTDDTRYKELIVIDKGWEVDDNIKKGKKVMIRDDRANPPQQTEQDGKTYIVCHESLITLILK